MLPLVLPPQSQGVLGPAGLFDRTWYLFFTAVQLYASSVTGVVQYGERSDREAADIAGLTDGALWIETDTGLVYQWRAASLEWFYVAGIQVGAFASRPATLGEGDTGLLFQTSDTFQLYQWSGAAWSLFTQTYQRTQSQLSAFAGQLGTADAGLLVNVTDYSHVLQWTGSAWSWGPGEQGSGMLTAFAVAPTGNGWRLCDGSSGVKYLKADGTTDTLTLPDTNGTAAYMKLGSAYADAITAATVPTISSIVATATAAVDVIPAGSTQVAAEAHTHAAPTATLPADPIPHFEALLYFRQ